MIRTALFLAALLAGTAAYAADEQPVSSVSAEAPIMAAPPALTITSTTVQDGQIAPISFEGGGNGCMGGNVSPQLSWSGEPTGTKSFAITIFDPDAKPDGYMHWTVINIPPSLHTLPADAGKPGSKDMPPSAVQVDSSAGQAAFTGACPPPGDGVHHYQTTVFALPDATVEIPPSTFGADLVKYLHDKSLASGMITPTYERK